MPRHLSPLATPALTSGVLIAAYLVARPYGDAAGSASVSAAAAFASPWWVAAHLAGAFGLAAAAWLAVGLGTSVPGRLGASARITGALATLFVLPYYGAETFALHVLGRAALAGDPGLLRLVDEIRDEPVAITLFAAGLLLLAASGTTMALAWQRQRGSVLLWPLAVGLAGFLPQFYLPPTGRLAYGLAYCAAAVIASYAVSKEASLVVGPHPEDVDDMLLG